MAQVSDEANASPEPMELTVPQSKVAELYYDPCGMIDHHHRCRQDDLDLEKNIVIMDWIQRVNISIFGKCVVDGYILY